MRKALVILCAAAIVMTAVPTFAELQTVQVGGNIRIRGNLYTNTDEDGGTARWGAGPLGNRAIGSTGITSVFDWDEDGDNVDFIEQRTRLNVKADFSSDVSAFIELDSYDIWGEDFRSDYVTGADGRAVSVDDVEVYQAYIEASEMFGLPLCLRVGRQEIALGSQWLVGVNDTSSLFRGLSFDGVRLVYDLDVVEINAIWAKLAEVGAAEEDGDVDLYGIYSTYKGLEDIEIDAYWLMIRDATAVADTGGSRYAWWNIAEEIVGLDDYDVTNLHTVGLRGSGTLGAIDFEAEVAYQFGDAGIVGSGFAPILYGDDDAEFGEWGANLEIGYTIDMAYQPRVFIGAAYLGGEDERDIGLFEWLSGPFNLPDASVSFNRLFSNVEYSEFIDNTDLSNALIIRGGVSAMPTENLELELLVAYFQTLEEFDAPIHFTIDPGIVDRIRIPILPGLPFLTEENDKELGLEVGLYATYNYTEDLTFRAGWAHLFVGEGLDDGQFSSLNGLAFNGGTDDDDADYVFVETEISF